MIKAFVWTCNALGTCSAWLLFGAVCAAMAVLPFYIVWLLVNYALRLIDNPVIGFLPFLAAMFPLAVILVWLLRSRKC